MRGQREPQPGISALARIRAALEADPSSFLDAFHRQLFGARPELAAQFPPGLGQHRDEFLRFLTYVVDAVATGSDPDELMDLLGQLGRDHRKYDLTQEHYQIAQTALSHSLSHTVTEHNDITLVGRISALVCEVMRQEAHRDAAPALWEAQVVERCDRPGPTVVVRLVADPATLGASGVVPFAVGQYLATQIPQRPGQWRYFSPALPPNEEGQLEIHVRIVPGGVMTGAVYRGTQPGDRWSFGGSYGSLAAGVDQMRVQQSLLMISGDTGVAPLRAIALAMALRADNPRTTVLVGARSQAELYDLATLRELARENSWLNVVAVCDSQPWKHLAVSAAEHAQYADRILLAGSPDMQSTCREVFLRQGISLEKVSSDPEA